MRPPENAEVAELAQALAQRVRALLKRRGLNSPQPDTEDSDPLSRDQPWLAEVYAGSICGRLATGVNAGRRVVLAGDRINPEAIDSRTGPRAATTASAPESAKAPAGGADAPDRSEQQNAPAIERQPRNYLWSELMKRVFAADVLACHLCGGRLCILATIRPPETTRKILEHLGLPSRPPPLAPAALQELPFASE